MGHFFWVFCFVIETKNDFGPKKVVFGPLLKSKVSHKKPSKNAGLRAFGPLSHFFFLLVAKKKLIIYIDVRKKVAFWPKE